MSDPSLSATRTFTLPDPAGLGREHWRRTFAGQIMASMAPGFPPDDRPIWGQSLKRAAEAARDAAEALCDELEIPE